MRGTRWTDGAAIVDLAMDVRDVVHGLETERVAERIDHRLVARAEHESRSTSGNDACGLRYRTLLLGTLGDRS